MSAHHVERGIWINAPRERVWQAITQPDQIQQWFSPGTPWVVTALEAGGKLYAVGYESQTGIIEVIDPPQRFSYRYELLSAGTLLSFVTTYTLDEENNGTRVTITETGVEAPTEGQGSGRGWGMALDNLKAYLEGNALPFPEGL